MRVRGGAVQVEDVGQAHTAGAEVKAAGGDLCGQGEGGTRAVAEVGGEPEDLVQLDTGDVRLGAEVGVAHDVEVGEAGEAESLGDATTTGGLDIKKEVSGIAGMRVQLKAGEECADEGGLVLAA